MNSLKHQPNLLYLIYVRLPKITILVVCPKLLRNVYKQKLLNARTIIHYTQKSCFGYTTYVSKYYFNNTSAPSIILSSKLGSIKEYYFNGNLHRKYGPAIEYSNNPSKNQYWINGEMLTIQGKNKKKYITWIENDVQFKFIIVK